MKKIILVQKYDDPLSTEEEKTPIKDYESIMQTHLFSMIYFKISVYRVWLRV